MTAMTHRMPIASIVPSLDGHSFDNYFFYKHLVAVRAYIRSGWANIMTALIIIMLFLSSVLSHADDIDIYLRPASAQKPNVLLILDTSDSMCEDMNGNVHKEESTYDPLTTYTGQTNAVGGAGEDDHWYLYERSSVGDASWPTVQNYNGFYRYYYRRAQTYNSYYRFYQKVPKSSVDSSCGIKEDFYLTTANDYDWNNAFDAYRVQITSSSTSNRDDDDDDGGGSHQTSSLCRSYDKDCNLSALLTSGAKLTCEAYDNYSGETGFFIFSKNQHDFLQQFYRFTIAKTAVKNTLDQIFSSELNYNLAIAAFHSKNNLIDQSVLKIHQPFTETNASGMTPQQRADLRNEMKRLVDGISVYSGGTPLVESLWEAKSYFRGETPVFTTVSTHAAGTLSGSNYVSPITSSCDSNHVVLFTDGAPFLDDAANADVTALAPPSLSSYVNSTGSYLCTEQETSTKGANCGGELVDWLNLTDHSEDLDGKQTVTSHVVSLLAPGSFANDSALSQQLKDFATSDELFHEAKDSETLKQALLETFSIIGSQQAEIQNNTITPPTLNVSSYNSLSHRNELYFSLFKPSSGTRWVGNLKRYAMNGNGEIIDSNNVPIVDENGAIKATSRSWWMSDLNGNGDLTDDADGGDVGIGGIATAQAESGASLSTPSLRKLYTYWGKYKELTKDKNAFPIDANEDGLDDKDYPGKNEDAFIAALSQSPLYRESKFNEAMTWIRGGDPENPFKFSSDFIHNSPVVVTYYQKGGKTFDDTIYGGSNLGFLQAINPKDGNELFAFMPEALLPNIMTYYVNSAVKKRYGLDAQLQIWRNDVNGDGNIVTKFGGNEAQKGEFIYLYQAMRRGGKNIYALDMTDRTKPEMLWEITPDMSEFSSLGQTWSAPQRFTLNWCERSQGCEEKMVLLFGGGYDSRYDDQASVDELNEGSALFLVDAKTGKRLWSAGHSSAFHHEFKHSSMRYSFPSDVSVMDANGDGIADYVYAVDIIGQLWRFDFASKISSVSKDISGGLIATVSNVSAQQPRRFFSMPDVSLFSLRGGSAHNVVAIASGNRASPNEQSSGDGVFIIKDFNVFAKPKSYFYQDGKVVGLSALKVINQQKSTNSLLGVRQELNQASQSHGFIYYFATNEKNLSGSITYGGKILMTSYQPPSAQTNLSSCEAPPPLGATKLVAVDLGRLLEFSVVSWQASDVVSETSLGHIGLPPKPVIYITQKCTEKCETDAPTMTNKAVVCMGLECSDDPIPDKPFWYKTYWRERN